MLSSPYDWAERLEQIRVPAQIGGSRPCDREGHFGQGRSVRSERRHFGPKGCYFGYGDANPTKRAKFLKIRLTGGSRVADQGRGMFEEAPSVHIFKEEQFTKIILKDGQFEFKVYPETDCGDTGHFFVFKRK